MITSNDPQIERRRQLLTILHYNAAQMDTADQRRLLRVVKRVVLLDKIHPTLGSVYLKFEFWLIAGRRRGDAS